MKSMVQTGHHSHSNEQLHLAHGAFEADDYSMRDDGVTDVEFMDILDFRNSPDVAIRQTMTEIQRQALCRCELTSFAKFVELTIRFIWCASVSVGSRVQFDGFDTQFAGLFNLCQLRINKQAHKNAGPAELIDALSNSL